jgi:cytochrome c oxidase subunit III
MKFFDTLSTKPWLQNSDVEDGIAANAGNTPLSSGRIALRFGLAVVGVLFFLFIITFLSRSQYPDFVALAGAPWQPFTDSSQLWLNTGILFCASVALQAGLIASRKDRHNVVVASVSATIFLTVLFLFAQFDLWLYLQSMGFYLNSNPANSYFYVLTAIHGIHLVGGLLALSYVVFRLLRKNGSASLSEPLQLCATYWHFLFFIWMVLFGLLTSTPKTINALAAMCGF